MQQCAHVVHMSSANAVGVTESYDIDNGGNEQESDIDFATILTHHQSTPLDIANAITCNRTTGADKPE